MVHAVNIALFFLYLVGTKGVVLTKPNLKSNYCETNESHNYSSGNEREDIIDVPEILDFGYIFFPFLDQTITINDVVIENDSEITIFQIEYFEQNGLMMCNFPNSEVVFIDVSFCEGYGNSLYLYFDGTDFSYSFTSKDDCKVNYYKEFVASEEENYILGFEEECLNPENLESINVFQVRNNFQNFVYNTNDINETDVTYQCSVYDSGYSNRIKITGDLHYVLDGETYPLIDTKVSIWDNDLIFDDNLESVYTNNNGHFEIFVDNQGHEGGIDPCLEIVPENHATIVKGETGPYRIWLEGNNDIVDGSTVDFDVVIYGDKSNRAAAYSIAEAERWCHEYVKQLENGTSLPQIVTTYPIASGNSSFNFNNQEIEISITHEKNWDVITHEYGHYINYYYFLSEYYFGTNEENYEHSLVLSPVDLHETIQSVELVYSESLASFHGLMAQKNVQNGNAFVNRADEKNQNGICYYYLNESHPHLYDSITNQIIYENCIGKGIGWEQSVIPFLYQTADLLGVQNLWNCLRMVAQNNLTRISPSLISVLLTTFNSYQNNIAILLTNHGFVPEPTAQISLLDTSWTSAEVTWSFNTMRTDSFHHNYSLEFYSHDFSESYRIDEPNYLQNGNNYSVTLSNDQLQSIVSLSGNFFHWRIIDTYLFENGTNELVYLTTTLASPFQRINKNITDLSLYETNVIHINNDYDYQWFSFSAPLSNDYKILSRGEADLVVESFSNMVLDNRSTGMLGLNDDDLDQNFGLEFSLNAEQTIYFRVSGINLEANTQSQIVVIEANHSHCYDDHYQFIDDVYHGSFCECGHYVREYHQFGTIGSRPWLAYCSICGQEYNLNCNPQP